MTKLEGKCYECGEPVPKKYDKGLCEKCTSKKREKFWSLVSQIEGEQP